LLKSDQDLVVLISSMYVTSEVCIWIFSY